MVDQAKPVDEREGLQEYADWHGLRNNISTESFAPGDLVVALNIDVDDALNISRRKGYSAPVTGAVDRDLWASGSVCLGVGSNVLKLIQPDYSTATLYAALSPSRSLSYAAVADRVFWVNGSELGCIQNGVNRSWGITPPAAPNASIASGSLDGGIYQVAVTYLRQDGQESGAARASVISIPDSGGISLSSISVSADPTITHKVIYATTVGGETLYRAAIIDNATTAFVIAGPPSDVSPLMTQFLSPPPAGDYIAESRGHMLVAAGSRLYPSEPYAHELFDLRKSIPFGDVITMIAPISDGKIYRQHGVFVGTQSQLIWLEGDSPGKWEYRVLMNVGVIPGTLSYCDGELLGAGDSKERIAFFATKTGLCAGKMGGEFVNLTQARFAYPVQERGAGIVRRHQGMAQYIVSIQGAETPGNVFV